MLALCAGLCPRPRITRADRVVRARSRMAPWPGGRAPSEQRSVHSIRREGPLLAASRTPSAPTADAIATRTASRRISFAKIHEPLQAPNLLGLQTESFDWLLGNDAWRARVQAAAESGDTNVPATSGLEEIFAEISPIEDFGQSM